MESSLTLMRLNQEPGAVMTFLFNRE